jgi:biotin operon repressor
MSAHDAPANSPRTFAERDHWMRALLEDTRVSEGARLAGVRLALFLYVKSGRCDPGYERLAQVLGISERSVFRRIAELEHAGRIAIDRQRGRGKLSNFHLVMAERMTAASSFSDPKKVTAASSFKAEKVTPVTKKGDSAVSEKVTPVGSHKAFLKAKRKAEKSQTLAPDLFSGKKDAPARSKHAARINKQAKPDIDASFQEFWAAYPKRVAKEAARKAFAAALKGGVEPEVLIAGAARYAAERAGQEARYTKHPATWLNGGCWADEPPGAPVIDQAGNVVAYEQPKPQQSAGRGFATIAEELNAELAATGREWF